MAEITASKIGDVLRAQLESYKASVDVREVGTVIQIGDGIARVDGLKGAMAGELLEFVSSGGEIVYGMALNLDENEVGAVLMGETSLIGENDIARTTGRVVEVPSGPALLGRIGQPPVIAADATGYADPLPQALVLTTIVISFAMTAFVIVLALKARAELGNDHVDGRESGAATHPAHRHQESS